MRAPAPQDVRIRKAASGFCGGDHLFDPEFLSRPERFRRLTRPGFLLTGEEEMDVALVARTKLGHELGPALASG